MNNDYDIRSSQITKHLPAVRTVVVEVPNNGLDIDPNKLPVVGVTEAVVPCVPKIKLDISLKRDIVFLKFRIHTEIGITCTRPKLSTLI